MTGLCGSWVWGAVDSCWVKGDEGLQIGGPLQASGYARQEQLEGTAQRQPLFGTAQVRVVE